MTLARDRWMMERVMDRLQQRAWLLREIGDVWGSGVIWVHVCLTNWRAYCRMTPQP